MAYVALLVYVLILFVRPQEWRVLESLRGVPILDLVVGIALVTWIGGMFGRRWRMRDAPQNWLMLGLFTATLMSHVRHGFFAMLISTFRDFGKTVLLYFLIVTLVGTVRKAKLLIGVMILGCLCMAFDGISQFLGESSDYVGFTGMNALVHAGAVRVRGFGIFNDPNDLALMLVAVLPFLFVSVTDRRSAAPRRLVSAVAVVPILACIYMTDSRGGWLALGAMIVAYLYLFLPYKKTAIMLGILAFGVLVALGPSRVGIASIRGDDGASRGRVAAWGYGNWMLKRWPLFGAGKGRFTEFSDEGRSAHNSFVHCWGDLGLFGYFFWLALLMASAKDGYALSKSMSEGPAGEARPGIGLAHVGDPGPNTGAPALAGLDPEPVTAPGALSEPDARSPSGRDAGSQDGPAAQLPPSEEQRAEAREIARLGSASLAGLTGYMAAGFFLSRTYTQPLYVLYGLFAVFRAIYERDVGPLKGGFVRKDLKLVLAAELVSIPTLWLLIRLLN